MLRKIIAGLAGVSLMAAALAQNVKISELPPASALTGSEVSPWVQSSSTVKVTSAQVRTYAQTGLGLGTMSTQNANAVAITGGSITGITDLAVLDGGTGSSTASGARTNLSAAALGANSDITSLAGLTTPLSLAQGGTAATSASAARTSLGLAIGTNVQAYNANLAAISGLTTAADNVSYWTGSGTAALTSLPSYGRTLIGSANAAAARSTLAAAGSGANSDITSITGLTTPLTIAQGGIGAATLPTGALKGAGTGAISQAAASDLSNGVTGSGAVCLATNCALTTPSLGTPTALVLTSATGLPLTTGVTGVLPTANGGTGSTGGFTAGSIIFAGSSGVYAQSNTNFFWDNINGRLGFGSNTVVGTSLDLSLPLTGATTALGINARGTVQSGVTTQARYISVISSTAAASFTSNIDLFYAAQGTFGAGSTVTNQKAYNCDSSLIGGTNNYCFYGNIPSGTGRYNLYMNGTAPNYLNGSLGIGMTPTNVLDITGARIGIINSANVGAAIIINSTFTNGRSYSIGSNFTTGTGEFALYDVTAGAERWRTDLNGAFLIGTTAISNSSAKMEIASAGNTYLRLSSPNSANVRGIIFGHTGDTVDYASLTMNLNSGELRSASGYTGSLGYFITFDTQGNEAGRFNPSGGFSVGATTDAGVTNILAAGTVKTGVYTVATLPTCNAGGEGKHAAASDLLAPSYLVAAAGSGTVHGPVYCNGTTWVVG